MTDQPAFDEDDLRSLGHKLAQLDLTDGERAAMAALLAEDDEVAGFGRFDIVGGIRGGIVEFQDGDDWFGHKSSGRHSFRAQAEPTTTFVPGRF